jgi:hypothetical protein
MLRGVFIAFAASLPMRLLITWLTVDSTKPTALPNTAVQDWFARTAAI